MLLSEVGKSLLKKLNEFGIEILWELLIILLLGDALESKELKILNVDLNYLREKL